MRKTLGEKNFPRQASKTKILSILHLMVSLKSTAKDREKKMATERKKKQEDFDMFAAPDTGTRRRRVAAPARGGVGGGPSGPAMSGGPSGPAMSGGPSGPAMAGRGKGAPAAPAKRRRRSSDDAEMQALYGSN